MIFSLDSQTRRVFAAACLSSALLLPSTLHAAEAATAPATGVSEVKIDNFAFTPNELTIKAGTKVTFTNHDDIPHSIVASDGTFHSKALDTDDSFAFTFASPGEFAYFCGLHPHMTAKVIVVP